MKNFDSFFELLLNVLVELFANLKRDINNLATVVVELAKLSSTDNLPITIYVGNKEPSIIYSAEDFFIKIFHGFNFYGIRNFKGNPLQLIGSCEKITHRALKQASNFDDFPNYKTQMII